MWEHVATRQCDAVEQLSNILGSEDVQRLLTKFAKTHCDNLNFRMWSTYMNMVEILLDFIRAERDENKSDLARFLTEIIVTKGTDLPQQCELVTGGGLYCATHARSTMRSEVKLQGNHEEADTRLVLHSCEAVSQGYKSVLVICRDTDVMLLLVHFIPAQTAEVCMISGTAKKRTCYPIHALSERRAKISEG